MHEGDRHAALADCGRDALDGGEAHVPAREDAGDARLEEVRIPVERPVPRSAEVGTREDEAMPVERNRGRQPGGLGVGADEDVEPARIEPPRLSRVHAPEVDRLERGVSVRAGTLILAVSIIVWALAYYPHQRSQLPPQLLAKQESIEKQLAGAASESAEASDLQGRLAAVENQIAGAYLENSYLGRMGKAIEPVVRPLGWDWRIGCAAIASFPAREVIVATLGIIYNLGEGQDEESEELKETLKAATWAGTDRPVFNLPVALSIMVFFALCAQCVSTLAVMWRETGSWRWPALTFVYMTVLAYVGAFVTYQVGMWLGGA